MPNDIIGGYHNPSIVPPLHFPREPLINEYLKNFKISPELANKIQDNDNKVIIKRIRITVWNNDTNGAYIYDEDVALPTQPKRLNH